MIGAGGGLRGGSGGSPRRMTTTSGRARDGRDRSGRTSGVVVITGASSGIGRATAHAFAARGARLVLAARSEASLHEVAQECRDRGGQALVVPTDVSSEQQVQHLVSAAVEEFGRIDVWVGGASVFSYGTFEQTPSEVFRQVLETNFFGQVHGARAVLPVFRAQGGGVLVLIASLYSKLTSPYLSPYITSKWALLALAEVLRQELRDADGVEVCAVLPATIDTPIYQHAANATGRRPHPLPPVVDPRRVARAVVRAAQRPRRVVVVGQVQRAAVVAHALVPRVYERAVGPVMDLLALRDGPVADELGTVFAPQPGTNRVSGGWRSSRWWSVPAAVAVGAAAVAGARSARRGQDGSG